MNWGSAAEFFEMGGYGLYVWGSYGVAALLMLAEPWLARRRHRRALRELRSAEVWRDSQEDAQQDAQDGAPGAPPAGQPRSTSAPPR